MLSPAKFNISKVLNYLLPAFVFMMTYGLWVIQPLPNDDWDLFLTGPERFYIPASGQELRYMLALRFLCVDPFSFYRIGTLIAAIFVVGIFWTTLKHENVFLKTFLTLLLVLGFPYLGHIGPWNIAAGQYAPAAAFLSLWFLIYTVFSKNDRYVWLFRSSIFAVTFFTALSHEVYLIAFSCMTLFLILEAFCAKTPRSFWNVLTIAAAYGLALVYYVQGGSSKIIDGRVSAPGLFGSLWTAEHFLHTLIYGTKEVLVLLKDSLPVFLLFISLKLKKESRTPLEPFYKVCLAASVGCMVFIYVNYFLIGPPQWRCRWLCAYVLALTCYAIPREMIISWFKRFPGIAEGRSFRYVFLILAGVLLIRNGFYTYYDNNIDVSGWLKFRQAVVERDPEAIRKLEQRMNLFNHSKAITVGHGTFGAVDDRYRYMFSSHISEVEAVMHKHLQSR